MANTLDHLQSPRSHWWLAVAGGVLTIIFGTVGEWKYEHSIPHSQQLLTIYAALNAIYIAVQMLVLHAPHFEENTNWCLELGRWLGAATLVGTTGGLLWHRLQHEYRFLKLKRWNGHYVVCGLGHKGFAFISSIKAKDVEPNARIVVIDPAPSHDLVSRCDKAGVCIIIADAANPDSLKQARVTSGKEIIAITPSDETNVRIAADVQKLRKKEQEDKGRELAPAICRVHMSSAYLPQTLQRWTEEQSDPTTILKFFDVFDNEARRILLALPLDSDKGIGQKSPLSVHVVILGMGRMGSALVARCAKMGHFANGKSIRISVVDRDAEKREQQFCFRYPVLANNGKKEICDLNFHAGEIDSYSIRKKLEDWAVEPDKLLHVFVCLDNNTLSTEFGLRVRDFLKDHPNCTISIRISSKESLAPILESLGDDKSSADKKTKTSKPHIRTFGMVEDTCTNETFRNEYNESLARIIHEAFVAEHRNEAGRQNDISLKPWDELADQFRDSNRQQADHIAIKMRAIGYNVVEALPNNQAETKINPDQINILAKLEHQRWNAERWLSGWHLGPKDKEHQISPYLVPWDQLPNEIQEYDRQSVTKIPGWLSQVEPKKWIVCGNDSEVAQ